ncbi:MAG: hypothetical protein LAP40_11215 [Acidobacteriia bacterium]|nr:hypothetical protein [Terriglobia bacterium]
MSEWLERELSRHLASTRAPEGLWDRLQRPLEPRRPAAPAWVRWPIAALLTLAASAGMLWLAGKPQGPELYPAVPSVRASEPPALPAADWPLHCTLPARSSAFQLAAFPVRKPPGYVLAAVSPQPDTAGCHQCHSPVLN